MKLGNTPVNAVKVSRKQVIQLSF